MTSDAQLLSRTVAERLLTRLDPLVLAPESIVELGGRSLFLQTQLQARFSQAVLSTAAADVSVLPYADASIDLIVSHLCLASCPDLNSLFSEVCRVLRVGGVFLLSFYGPDTFRAMPQVTLLRPDMHEIGDALIHAKLSAPVLDVEFFRVDYDTPDEVNADLIATGEAQWLSLEHSETTLSYEVIYGHAWKAETPMPRKWQEEGWMNVEFS